jgi:hypothetical protein
MYVPMVRFRNRVQRSCDGCRIKKTRYNGSSPCLRCKTDNAICCAAQVIGTAAEISTNVLQSGMTHAHFEPARELKMLNATLTPCNSPCLYLFHDPKLDTGPHLHVSPEDFLG